MARIRKDATFNPTDEEIVVDDEVKAEAEEESFSDSGVTLNTNVSEKKCKIKVRTNHSCHIGGTFYSFEAGKTYNVPYDVKRVLSGADLLTNL